MRRVIIESPYAGDRETHARYLQRCIRDCLDRGESPYASHLMLTDALDDDDPKQRARGFEAGFAWRRAADATVVYTDYGISRGMKVGIENAKEASWDDDGETDDEICAHPIEYRTIGRNP